MLPGLGLASVPARATLALRYETFHSPRGPWINSGAGPETTWRLGQGESQVMTAGGAKARPTRMGNVLYALVPTLGVDPARRQVVWAIVVSGSARLAVAPAVDRWWPGRPEWERAR